MKTKKLCCLITLLCLLFCGCAKKSEPMKANYYPDCYEPLAYLHSRTAGAASGAAKGAIKGSVISGIAAAIIGAINGRLSPQGMLGGVAAGAVVGGLAGGVSGHSDQEKQDNQRLTKYLDEVDGDIEGMDITAAAATVSRQCYTKAFKGLLAETRDGSLTAAAAQRRYDEIAAGEKEACELLGLKPDAEEMAREFAAARADS